MDNPKRPRGRPATGRKERKNITLDLTLADYEYLTKMSKLNQSTRRKTIFDALALLEEKITK